MVTKARASRPQRRPPSARTAGRSPAGRPHRSSPPADAVFFESGTAWRAWLQAHAAGKREVWVGYFKRRSGRPSVTWSESVDHALCYGWIDGVRQRLDDERYRIRFTPRQPSSVWSAVNIRRVEALIAAGQMRRAGLVAFAARREHRTGIYSYEQRPSALPAPYAAILREHPAAATYFAAQPPSYRRAAIWWVVSAKQDTTRRRRLDQLISDSAAARRIKAFVARRGPS